MSGSHGDGVERVPWRALAASLALFGLAVPGFAAYTAHRVAAAERTPLVGTPADLGLAYEDISFPARDALTLRGWFIPALPGEAARTVVLVHGQHSNRADGYIGFLPLAAGLVKTGYNVLTFDLRGHGESEGRYRTFGDRERHDLKGALDYLDSRGAAGSWVAAVGFSLGAGTVMMTAPEEPRLKAIVEDSGYADIRELIDAALPGATGLPAEYSSLVIGAARLFVGDVDAVKPERVIAGMSPRPLLIIHGTADETVPVDHARRLSAAYPAAETWILEGVTHVAAHRQYPEEYLRRVLATFERAGEAPRRGR